MANEEKQNNKIEEKNLKDDNLKDVSGGYGIIHRHDGFKTLIDDNGKKVDQKFWNTYQANDYARHHKKDGNFSRGKEWEEY